MQMHNPPNQKKIKIEGFENKQEKEKIENSMLLVDDMRISPFFPLQKISHNSKLQKDFVSNGNRHIRHTSWGSIEIRNRLLTQSHLEIFSAIMAYQKKCKKLKSGRIAIYFSLYEVSKVIGKTWSGRTSQQMEERIRQIRDTVIVRKIKNGGSIDTNIIQEIRHIQEKDRDEWVIILSDAHSKVYQEKLTINYKDRLGEIISINGKGAGLIKSIVHFCISHNQTKTHKIGLIQLLQTIGHPEGARQLEMAITTINAEAETLKKFNIFFHSKKRIIEYGEAENIQIISAKG